MIHENTFKKVDFNGAKGLVFLGEKILTYRRDYKTENKPGCIDLPGGGREGDESPFETFQREVKEEFGLSLTKENILFSCPHQSVIDPAKESYFIVAKLSEVRVGDVVFGDEGVEWFFMDPEEFISRSDGIERQQKRVSSYLKRNHIHE